MGRWQYKPTAANDGPPIDQGMAVMPARNSPTRTEGVKDDVIVGNARLTNQTGDVLDLWVYEVTANFAMAGNTAQSRGRRDFYARNFTQPSFTVKGQAASNYQYNELAEFVRFSHRAAVNYVQRDLDFPTIRFELFAGGTDTIRNHKGSHRRMVLRGLIPKVERGATRFEFAKDYEFNFVVTRSLDGLMTDDAYHALRMQSWMEQWNKAEIDSLAVRNKTDLEADEYARQGIYADNDFQAGLGFGAAAYRKSSDGSRPD
jgi:hypothetical protein